MLAKAALVLIVLQTVASQRPEDNKKPKSQQWKNFLRDWNILMKHIFSPEEEESLIKCCEPSKKEALQACIDKSGLTSEQHQQLKEAVKKWRASRDKNDHSSQASEEEELSKVADSKTSRHKIAEKARTLAKCIAKIK